MGGHRVYTGAGAYLPVMSDSRAFCPRCGAAVAHRSGAKDDPLDQEARLCDDCYLGNFDLVDAPDRVEVAVCSQCGAVRRGDRWTDVGARDYTDVAVDVVTEAMGVHVAATDVSWSVEPEPVDQNTIEMHCRFTGVVRDTDVSTAVTVPVYIARETCRRCGRIAGEYYASVVQVRATDRQPTRTETDRAVEIAENYVADRAADGDRDAFITEVARTDDGVDLKVSDSQIGRAIATRIRREFGGTITDSETLVGEDEEGGEMYRVTFAVRLPRFAAGDVIAVDDDGPVLVRSARGTLEGVRLATGEPYRADTDTDGTLEARKLGTRADGRATALVAVVDDRAVQVIDPETYEPTTVPRPDYLDPGAETVAVIKTRAGLHVLPDPDA